MSKAASRPELETLHDTLAKVLAEAVKETEIKIIDLPDAAVEGGSVKTVVRTRNAAILNAARQFLKDNGVECAPGYPSDALKEVKKSVESLPFPAHPGGEDEDHTLQ